jgi:exodeoxyribonuclease VII large subunit
MVSPLDIATSPTESLTLLDLQRMVRSTLEGRFATPLWISAEISELKVNRSGHCYLNLVEKGASDGAPRAEARGVIWRSAYSAIASQFEAATGAQLTNGIRVLVRVVVTYHEIYGFSLQIIDLDASYTLGDIERRRRETIAQLQSDGVWDMNRELDMPRPTLRIAVVSSATAAGYRDFMNELARGGYRYSVTLFESLMQGDMAETSVVKALAMIALREDEFDVVTIIRGGGSVSDLALFDSYLIASHVAQFPLPVITGIGHDKDVSVTDMVAHTMCKTPTAVATRLIELVDEEMEYLLRAEAEVTIYAEQLLNNYNSTLALRERDLFALSNELLMTHEHHVESLYRSIVEQAQQLVEGQREYLTQAEHFVDSHSLDNILRLGFAVLHGEVSPGERITIERLDDIITAEIINVEQR